MATTPVDTTQQLPDYDLRKDMIEYIRLRLGGDMIEVELDEAHYMLAIKQALRQYRAKSEQAEEESYAFLDLIKDTQEYILPKEITAVRTIFRRGVGGLTNGGSQFEPFSAGYLNTYMLAAGRVGGLSNYELFVDYQKLTMLMFGGYINYTFDPATHKLTVIRKMPSEIENVLLWVYNYKPDQALLNHPRGSIWIQDYALALSKHMLGEARERFSTIVGPGGGSALNGTALKTEGKAEMEALLKSLDQYIDGAAPLSFIIG